MKPVSPVMPHHPEHQKLEITIAKDQPEWENLPALRILRHEGWAMLSRWQLSWRERLAVLFTGSIYVEQLTIDSGHISPYKLSIKVDDMEQQKIPESSQIVEPKNLSRSGKADFRALRREFRRLRGGKG